MSRDTPKSGWCETFAKHCTNGVVSGYSGGYVADGATHASVKEDGSAFCYSHQQVRRKKSSLARYH